VGQLPYSGLILLISGPIAVGKTSVTEHLIEKYGFQKISTGSYLLNIAQNKNLHSGRRTLQELGDKLDADTDYKWVVDDVAKPKIELNPDVKYWLFDSVRKPQQIEHFKALYPNSIRHVHLSASEPTLELRYNGRKSSGGEYEESPSYRDAISHSNEVIARSLIGIAEAVILTENTTPETAADNIVQLIMR
jgi:adenylosuccinate synthase